MIRGLSSSKQALVVLKYIKIILDSRFWFLYLSPSLDASSYGCNGEGLSHIFGGVIFFSDDYRCFNGFEFVLEGGVTGLRFGCCPNGTIRLKTLN